LLFKKKHNNLLKYYYIWFDEIFPTMSEDYAEPKLAWWFIYSEVKRLRKAWLWNL